MLQQRRESSRAASEERLRNLRSKLREPSPGQVGQNGTRNRSNSALRRFNEQGNNQSSYSSLNNSYASAGSNLNGRLRAPSPSRGVLGSGTGNNTNTSYFSDVNSSSSAGADQIRERIRSASRDRPLAQQIGLRGNERTPDLFRSPMPGQTSSLNVSHSASSSSMFQNAQAQRQQVNSGFQAGTINNTGGFHSPEKPKETRGGLNLTPEKKDSKQSWI